MHRAGRAILVALLMLLAVVLAISQPLISPVALAATALIMGGTGQTLSIPPDTQPFVSQYVAGANSNYIAPQPVGFCNSGCVLVGAVTPEEWLPFSAGTLTLDQSVAQGQQMLNTCIQGSASCEYTIPATGVTTTGSLPGPYVAYGWSQSAMVATLEKRYLAANDPTAPVSFILVANPNRPNGGIAERFNGGSIPGLGVTFNGATPTNTNFPTVDVARQYDGWADFPTNPLNGLAVLNATMGINDLHGNYYNVGTPVLQDQYGDTTYYLIPATTLPLLIPLSNLGGIGVGLADMMDPTVRVLVESGYDRTISPGQPTPVNYSYFPNPTTLFNSLNVANQTGMDNLLQDLGMGRPLGTTRPDLSGQGAYGVGGPPVTMNPTTNQQNPPQATTLTAPVQPAPSPSLAVNTSGPSVVNNSASVQRQGSAAPSNTPTQPAASSTSNAAALTAPTTAANEKPIQPTISGPIGSTPPTREPLRPSDNGPLTKTFDGLTGGPKPKSSTPSGSASAVSGDGSTSGDPARG
jgi:hypothetical protein